MIMADVLKWLLLIAGTLITTVSYWLLFEACFPGVVGRSMAVYQKRPIRAIVLGIVLSTVGIAVGVALLNVPNAMVKFLGTALLVLLASLGYLGSAGFARFIGTGLPSPTDALQPWKRVLRGGTVLSITFVLPFIGWFMILPVTLLSGVGAAALALCRRPEQPEAVPVQASAGTVSA